MATFSGVVLVTGTDGIGPGGIFEPISFDSNFDHVFGTYALSGTQWDAQVIESTAMLAEVVMFDFRDRVYGAQTSFAGSVHSDFLVLDGAVDFGLNRSPVSSGGVTVLNFGFGMGFSFIPPSYVNSRIFPTAVEFATLFPGDVPRGESLN